MRSPTTACAVKSVQLIGLFIFLLHSFRRLIKGNKAQPHRGVAALNADKAKAHAVSTEEDTTAAISE